MQNCIHVKRTKYLLWQS